MTWLNLWLVSPIIPPVDSLGLRTKDTQLRTKGIRNCPTLRQDESGRRQVQLICHCGITLPSQSQLLRHAHSQHGGLYTLERSFSVDDYVKWLKAISNDSSFVLSVRKVRQGTKYFSYHCTGKGCSASFTATEKTNNVKVSGFLKHNRGKEESSRPLTKDMSQYIISKMDEGMTNSQIMSSIRKKDFPLAHSMFVRRLDK